MIAPAYCRPSAYESLASELPLLTTRRGLVRAACAVAAHEHGGSRTRETLDALDAVVATVRQRAPSDSPDAQLAHLHDVMFDILEFHGNTDGLLRPGQQLPA